MSYEIAQKQWVAGRKELNTLRFLKKLCDLQGKQENVRLVAAWRLGRNKSMIVDYIHRLKDMNFIDVGSLVENPQTNDDLYLRVTDEGVQIIGYPLTVMEQLAVEL